MYVHRMYAFSSGDPQMCKCIWIYECGEYMCVHLNECAYCVPTNLCTHTHTYTKPECCTSIL